MREPNLGFGWPAFWSALAKIVIAICALYFGIELLDLLRETMSPN